MFVEKKGGRVWPRVVIPTVLALVLLGSFYTMVYRVRHPEAGVWLGCKTLIVKTGSMEPAIKAGAMIVVRPVSFERVKVGNIVTLERPDGSLNTHRVISRTEEALFTQGDNADIPDSLPVTRENYRYRLLFTVNWVAGLHTPMGVLTRLGIPILAISLLAAAAAALTAVSKDRKRANQFATQYNAPVWAASPVGPVYQEADVDALAWELTQELSLTHIWEQPPPAAWRDPELTLLLNGFNLDNDDFDGSKEQKEEPF
jgi:signal peptidase